MHWFRKGELQMADIIMIVDMLTAKVAMLAFLIVAAKFITKHTGIKTADRFLMKIHRPVGYILAVTGLTHGILSFRIFSTTPIIVYVLGFICLLAIIAAIITFFLKNKLGNKWLIWYRITTIIALFTLVLHPMM